jgi:hypothetical protein
MAIKAEMILMNVLNAQTDDATVIRNAEDCGIAVIDCITPTKSMELLVIVIDDENTKPHQLSAAIKMLSNVISRMSDAEVRRTMNSLIPRMVKV